ncbi:MAG: DUF4230 domain-containing protein [Bacteroidales bacterium]|nr:DUF4230 domain-containing protein [Bacteroidales bacterium]
MKKIIIGIIVVVVLGVVAFTLYKTGVFNKNEELAIDETANVVTEIKKISEFTSACFYEDIILQDTKTSKVVNNAVGDKIANLLGKNEGLSKDELVIVASGKVRAGFHLNNLDENHIFVSGDTLTVDLPKAEIFDVIVNPSDFDIYIEDGKWSHEQVTKLEEKAVGQIKEDAEKDGILDKATRSGVKKLTDMFKTFGFSVVNITIEGQTVEIEEEKK